MNVNVKALRKEKKTELQAPLGVGMRLVIREEDLIKALRAPVVQQEIQKLLRGLTNSNSKQVPAEPAGEAGRTGIPQRIQDVRTKLDEYRILNPNVEFLPGGRIRLQVEIEEVKTAQKFKIEAESGITFAEGQRLTLTRPMLKLNGEELPEQLIQAFATDLFNRFKLEQLSGLPGSLGQVKWSQLTARVIKLEVKDKKLELVAFLRLPQGLKI
ncbi:MAG: LmeA family phospholipid-binding protein [Leptolyngbyaceae cyanobacterium CAN_BIN12]|nr:LmeA family phospholipid-binding protein [Leptolyngbyaceae cyanobacterium CAN_BIN12]